MLLRLPRFGRNAWLLLLTSAGGAISVGVYGVVFNLYIASLGLSTSVLGVILGVGTAGLAVAVVPSGVLADVWGRKRTLVLGGVLSGPFTAAQVIFTPPWAIIASGFVAGLGGAAIATVALPLLVEAAPAERRAGVLSAGGALALLGSAAGSALGGWLPAALAPYLHASATSPTAYRWTLLLSVAVAGLTALPVVLWFRDPHRPGLWRGTLAGLRAPRWRRLAWRLAAVAGTVGLGAGFVIPYFNLYFTRVVGLSTAQYGALSAVGQLVLGLATLLAGLLVRRVGVVLLAAATQLLSVPLLLALAAPPPLLPASLAYIGRQALMDMATPVAQGWLLSLVPPEARATTASLLEIAQQGPWALSSAAGGTLQAHSGYGPGFVLTAACYVTSSLLWLLLFRREKGAYGAGSGAEGTIERRELQEEHQL